MAIQNYHHFTPHQHLLIHNASLIPPRQSLARNYSTINIRGCAARARLACTHSLLTCCRLISGSAVPEPAFCPGDCNPAPNARVWALLLLVTSSASLLDQGKGLGENTWIGEGVTEDMPRRLGNQGGSLLKVTLRRIRNFHPSRHW